MAETPEVAEATAAADLEDRSADFLFGSAEPETPAEEAPAEEVEPTEEGDDREVEPEVEGEDEIQVGNVEIDGVLYENVPQELIAQIDMAKDYTQKTQSVAAERQEVEVIQQGLQETQRQYEFANEVQPLVIQAQQFEGLAEQWREHLRTNVESMTSTDIEKARIAIDDALTSRDTLVQQITAKQQEFDLAREQSLTELVDKSSQVLRSKIHNWDTVSEKVEGYITGLGFTEAQVSIAKTDPRQMEVAHKAMLYDQLQEKKPTAVQKAQATITTKPRKAIPKGKADRAELKRQLKSKNTSPKKGRRLIEQDMSKSSLFDF